MAQDHCPSEFYVPSLTGRLLKFLVLCQQDTGFVRLQGVKEARFFQLGWLTCQKSPMRLCVGRPRSALF